MSFKKDPNTGKWLVQYRYTDWSDKRIKSTKRGFNTKKEAKEWLNDFLMKTEKNLDMKFSDFTKLYLNDIKNRIRLNTYNTKISIINSKIIPFFGKMKINSIKPMNIRVWQNKLISRGYSQTYLKTINNQLTAIFNYAVKYYDLKDNPCFKAGSIGKGKADKMNFWTKDEFSKFIDNVMDKHQSYIMFMLLYWTGIRTGEMLALTVEDFDFKNNTLKISKSYQRIKREDVITPPKTPKSNRIISLPNFLIEDLKDYFDRFYEKDVKSRVFPYSKYFLHREMKRGTKASGLQKIRVHDLRHSHASLLVEMGFTPLAIAERLGHDRIETTMNTYSHLYPDKQDELAAKLNEKFKEIDNEE